MEKSMGISIKSVEAERKLRRASRLMGKSLTATVIELADGKLKELDAKKDREKRLKAVEASVRRIKSLPVLSTASEDEILGYNDKGFFD
jgi:antitoxin VapB